MMRDRSLKNVEKNSHVTPGANAVESQLIDTANSIEKAMTLLAASQETFSPPILKTELLVTPQGGMGGTANIDWSGPLAPLLHKLANMSNYRLKTLGAEPVIPIIVNITAKNGIIAEILQNASLQAGERASVMVYPDAKVIELRYTAN